MDFLFLLVGRGPVKLLGTAMMLAGSLWSGAMFLASNTSPTDYVQGGIAAGAIAFAGGVVRYMGSMVDKERARGDRLEVALLDKVLPALTSSATAVQQASDAMKLVLAAQQGRGGGL